MENQKQNQNSLAERIKKRIFDRYPPKVDSAEKAVLCLRDACLQKRVSLFQSVTANIPIRNVRLKRILQDFRRGRYRKQIECLRAETDKKKRDELKMQLPAVTIQSEPCSKRGKAYCKNNALVCLDIDNVPDPEKLKQKMFKYLLVVLFFDLEV